MNGKNKTLAIIVIIIAVILLSAVPAIIIISANKKEKNTIEWVDISEIPMDEEIPEPVEEEIEITAVTEEPVILTRSSNIKIKPEIDPESYDEIPDNMVKITIDGVDILVSEDELYSPEEDILTTSADDLVKWAFRAYYEDWQYVYGGCEEGYVDCSGLIKSKVEVCARGTEELLAESPLSGSIETIPDIPGLGVYTNGHVGIYVGDGMVIDARTETSGIGYDSVEYETWLYWFEIKGVDYSRYTMSGSE